MGILLTQINSNYKLNALLAIYDGNNQAPYVEYLTINRFDNSIEEHRPLSMDALDNLYRFMLKEKTGRKTLSGAIPRNMLYANPDLGYYVWWIKPATRTLIATDQAYQKFTNRQFNMPTMVFAADNDTLSVYVCETAKVSEKTKLFPAPLYNVHSDGSLCTGSTRTSQIKSKETYEEFMTAWEMVLFRSKFSHGNDGNSKLMKKVVDSKKFPWKELKKLKTKREITASTVKSLFV